MLKLYTTFGKYIPEGIHYCDYRCIDEYDVRKLNSQPLRDLETDDLIPCDGRIYTHVER